jgi:hypothetical protein
VNKQVVIFDLDGLAGGAPLPPSHGQTPQLFALLGVHADHRLAVGLVLLDLLVEVAELGIPIGVLGALERLDVGLQAEPFPLQQSTHRRDGDRMALPGEFVGQVPQRLGCPPQRRHRTAALVRLHQRQQGWDELRVLPGGRLASPTRPADPAGRERRLAGLQLEHALADGRLADAGHLRDRAHATMAQQPRLDRQRQALLALVEVRQQDLEPRRELTRTAIGMRMRRIAHQQAQRRKTTHYFVPASMGPAALDGGTGHGGLDDLAQPEVGVGDDQLHPGQLTGPERAKEGRPERGPRPVKWCNSKLAWFSLACVRRRLR